MPILSLQDRLLLKPWFSDKAFTEAKALLDKGIRPWLLAYRQGGAALWPTMHGASRLTFAATNKTDQGFRLIEASCTLCHLRRTNGDLCPHLAILAAEMLIAGPKGPAPAPLLYEQSPWAAVGRFLHQQKETLHLSMTADGWLALTTKTFRLETQVAENDLTLAKALFPTYRWPLVGANSQSLDTMATTTWSALKVGLRSETEVLLNSRGQESQGQRLAASIWGLLTQACNRTISTPLWQLQRHQDNTITLTAAATSGPVVFRLTPQPELLLDLLRQAGFATLITYQAKARAYSKLRFDPEGGLLVEPWLELADGQRLRRQDLNPYRFGRAYSLSEFTFFEVEEQEVDLTDDGQESLPLFAFIKPVSMETHHIPAADIPAFMERQHQALMDGGHDLDPRLLEFTVIDLPEALEIDGYQEEDDWCLLGAHYRFGDNRIAIDDVIRLQQSGSGHVAGTTTWLRLGPTPLAWLHALPIDRQVTIADGTPALRLTRRELMALTGLVPKISYPAKASVRETLRHRLHTGADSEVEGASMPPHLRPYQRQGMAWLYHLYGNGVGGVLADDMGLGKTHQALGLLSLIARKENLRALVVCPASVLPHWGDKLVNFYPQLSWQTYYGPGRQATDLASAEIILTTYGVLRQDIALLCEQGFAIVLFDEIQQIKNKRTATYQAACQLPALSYGLTGTPIENSINDLKAIFDLCLPGLLGSDLSFQRVYLSPIEEEGNQQRAEALQSLISPFILRRDKAQVLAELPEVIEDIRFCSLSDDQVALYQQVIENEGRPLLATLHSEPVIPYFNFLAVVQELKQICNHPGQLMSPATYQGLASGKWDLFVEILDECLDAGLKVVVFSQYMKMLDIIEAYLVERGVGHSGLRGSMSPGDRQKRISSFNEDRQTRVFCASLLAGGTGIDLTAAQVVIHYDRWWNAAREEQATARVHRFGQKQVVQVVKFITQGTVEEKIHRLITRKKALANDMIQVDDDSFVKRLSREDLAELLQWGE